MWSQNYDPMGNPWLSTFLSALPLMVLLGGLAILRWRAPVAALAGLVCALLVAIVAFGMPWMTAFAAAGFGAAYGLLPIGWIVLNVIFLYQLTLERGLFDVMRNSIASIVEDSRLQLLLVAFCFGAFFEGAAGFGTPVAVTGAVLAMSESPAACSWTFTHCQHCAGGVRRAGYAVGDFGGYHRSASGRSLDRGWPHHDAVRIAGAVLVAGGVLRLATHVRGLARSVGGGCEFFWHAAGHLEPAWPVVDSHRGVSGFDSGVDAISACVEACNHHARG
jgi:hypothetical protein